MPAGLRSCFQSSPSIEGSIRGRSRNQVLADLSAELLVPPAAKHTGRQQIWKPGGPQAVNSELSAFPDSLSSSTRGQVTHRFILHTPSTCPNSFSVSYRTSNPGNGNEAGCPPGSLTYNCVLFLVPKVAQSQTTGALSRWVQAKYHQDMGNCKMDIFFFSAVLTFMQEESWSQQALAGFRAYQNVVCLEELGARAVAALHFPAAPAMPILSL